MLQMAPAVRQVAEIHRADEIGVGGDVVHPAGGQQQAYILDLLVGQGAVVGDQHAGDGLVAGIGGDLQTAVAALLQEGIGGQGVDVLPGIVFLKIADGGGPGGEVVCSSLGTPSVRKNRM